MSMADILKKQAEKTGQKTIVGESANMPSTPQKPNTADGLANALASAKANTEAKKNAPPVKKPRGVLDTEFKRGVITMWSFSTLTKAEKCLHAVKLEKVDGVQQSSGPAAQRGSDIHDGIEQWVRGNVDSLPHDRKTKFNMFTEDFKFLREQFIEGNVVLEEKWGIRPDWSPCDWDNNGKDDPELWGKAALDALIIDKSDPDNITATIIDYKTGSNFQKTIPHSDQGLNYALHVYHRYPEVKTIKTEFWYIDHGNKLERTYNRKTLAPLLHVYHERAKWLTTREQFLPSPSVFNCQWCSYGSNKARDGRSYGNSYCGFDVFLGDTNE